MRILSILHGYHVFTVAEGPAVLRDEGQPAGDMLALPDPDPTIIREQIRVMRAALAEIASIPKHGEPEEDGSPHAQDWDDNGGYYAIKALHNAIDKARAVIDATKEG